MGAAALPLVAMGLQVGGTIFGGIEENKAARRAAAVDEENARLTELQASIDATGIRRDERMQAGEMLAGMGGDGFAIGSGSAQDVILQSAFNRERDVAAIKYAASGEARGLRQQAKEKRRAGRNALIGSLFSAAGSAIKGVGEMNHNNMLGGSIKLSRRTGGSDGSGLVDPRRYGKTPEPWVKY